MAKLILDYSQGENQYSDGDIETELLNYLKNEPNCDKIIKNDNRWPIFYHLSHLRENILNWYPFKKDAEVLEVGAGCGAITGILCKKAKHVTAVELTQRRAEINFQRHSDKENLDIYVGDIFKVNFKKKFDYITVIGVLEYAAFMSDSKDPYSAFLNTIKKFLKDDGHIILAIENRFGMKYFSGAREDHTQRFYDGVNGYTSTDKIKTFTKGELTRLLDKNSLTSHRFYYPFPDYKFPTSIYTDDSINDYNCNTNTPSYDSQRYRIFNEGKVSDDFAKEKILEKFSNSFFVDIAKEGTLCDNSIKMAKISSARGVDYRIATLIKEENNKKIALKIPLTEGSKTHLANMVEFYNINKTYHGINLVDCKLCDDGSVAFEFAKGESFADILKTTYKQSGLSGIYPLLDKYHKFVFKHASMNNAFYTKEFSEYYGDERCKDSMECVPLANIDSTFDNIFYDKDKKATLIDYEWVAQFPVPADYLFWRALFFFDLFSDKENEKEQIYEHYNITREMQKIFLKWEINFTTNKIGCITIENKPCIELDLNNIDLNSQFVFTTTVFFDMGNGFQPENSVSKGVVTLGDKSVMEVKIPKGVRAIRFDPTEGISTQCKIVSAICGQHEIKLQPLNNIASDSENDYFLTLDPVYTAAGTFKAGSTLKITFVLSKIDTSLADNAINIKYNKYEEEMKTLDKHASAYEEVINSRSWKITAPLRKVLRAVKK